MYMFVFSGCLGYTISNIEIIKLWLSNTQKCLLANTFDSTLKLESNKKLIIIIGYSFLMILKDGS